MESSPLLILLLCYFLHDNICVKKKNFIHLSLQAWVSHCVKRGDTGEILRIYPYSVQMLEYTAQNNSQYGHFSSSEYLQGLFFHFRIFSQYLPILNLS